MLQNLIVLFNKNFSKVFLIGTICFVLLFNINESPWKNNRVIDWDVTSYYGYLPAFFIHQDLSLDFIEKKGTNYSEKHQFWPEIAPNGGKVIKTTMGMSFLYSPFFVLAHIEAKLFSQKQDGFSYPYHKWIHFSGVFYFIIGLIFLRKVLLEYFSEVVSGLTILIIVCCTNALYYCSFQPAMPHITDFSLLSIFLYFSIKWFKFQTYKTIFYLGIISGLMVLIRPTNLLFFLFPLLLNVSSFKGFSNKIKLFFYQWKQILLLGVISFLIILPQLFYWKFTTDSYVFNSYIGETFFWSNPHILEGLFSYRKGWLVYSPIMVFSLIGLSFLYVKRRDLFLPVFLFFIINIYLIFSWWSWWYGGGFGMRSLIDCYPLLCFPLAAFLNFIINRKTKIYSILFILIIILTFKLNLIQIHQYKSAVIHWDGMTKEAFWASFAGKKIDASYWDLIKQPDYDRARNGEEEYDFKPF